MAASGLARRPSRTVWRLPNGPLRFAGRQPLTLGPGSGLPVSRFQNAEAASRVFWAVFTQRDLLGTGVDIFKVICYT